jgi:hypothetical protein
MEIKLSKNILFEIVKFIEIEQIILAFTNLNKGLRDHIF